MVTASQGTQCSFIVVTWSFVSFACGYHVDRSTSSNGPFVTIASSVTGTSYQDTSASVGTEYFYKIQTVCCVGGATGLSVATGRGWRGTSPVAPGTISASDGTVCAGVQVQWSAVSGSVDYSVHRSTSNSPSTSVVIASQVLGLSTLDTSATSGTAYFYWVKARNACGTSGFSPGDAGHRPPALAAPGNVSATDGTICAHVLIQWSQVPGATGYELWRNTTNNSGSAGLLASNVLPPFADVSVPTGTTFYYWVKAVNAVCTSTFSPGDAGRRGVTATPPTSVSATDGSLCGAVRVSWSGATGAGSYQVWRALTNNSGSAAPIASVAASPFDDGTAVPGTTYYYWVRTIGSCDTSGVSPSDSGYRMQPPLPPGAVTASDGSSCVAVQVTWQPVAGGPTYEVWRGTSPVFAGATRIAPSATSPYDDATAAADQTYHYWVVGVLGGCNGSPGGPDPGYRRGAPAITTQPLGGARPAGSRVVLTVAATGTAPLAFRWRKDRQPLSDGGNLSGTTTPTLVIDPAGVADSGAYDVEVTNSCGSAASSEAQLSILDPVVILAHPRDQSECEGQPILLTAAAGGSAPLAYQWLRNDSPIPGATAPTHFIAAAAPADSGTYRVRVSNGCCQAQSRPAVVFVAPRNPSTWRALGSGAAGPVHALVATSGPGGVVAYAGGDFTSPASYLARWNGTAWTPVGSGVNGPVHALALDPGGVLYAAGAFTMAGGVPANRVARWDGQTWQALGPGLDDVVLALEFFGGQLHAGGAFGLGGNRNHVGRWDGVSWSPVGDALGSPANRVTALAVHDDGGGDALYAGGDFSGGVVRLVGGTWTLVGSGLGAGPVLSLRSAPESGGAALVAGGGFTTSGLNRIARWRNNAWTSLGGGLNGTVRALALLDDGAGPALHVGGDFTLAGSVPAARVARWTGSSWSALGAGTDGSVQALAPVPGLAQSLLAGGAFTRAGEGTALRLARWDVLALSLALNQPDGSGSLQLANLCGPVGAGYFTAVTLDPRNDLFPGTGSWFGLHITAEEHLTEFLVLAVPPFVGVLDASGSSRFSFPAGALPFLIGQRLHAVTVLYDPGTGALRGASMPTSLTVQ
jgi:fibronectin type 3 domain-containing protein